MSQNQEPPAEGIRDGDPIGMDALAGALTRSPLAYSDGTAQVFLPDGSTTFTERDGSRTTGEWGVDEGGRFWSFWPRHTARSTTCLGLWSPLAWSV